MEWINQIQGSAVIHPFTQRECRNTLGDPDLYNRSASPRAASECFVLPAGTLSYTRPQPQYPTRGMTPPTNPPAPILKHVPSLRGQTHHPLLPVPAPSTPT